MPTVCSSGLATSRCSSTLRQSVPHLGRTPASASATLRTPPHSADGRLTSGLWCCHATRVTPDRIATQTIDDIDKNYCDDFECQSSPAVEQFVRSFARDTTRLRYAPSLFQPDVKYSDGFRTFQGNTKYANQRWLADNIQKPSVTINNMRMLDKATAQIDWRVSGSMSGAQVDIPITSVITMNLLTGRIVNHKETWDLSKVPQPAATLATLNRMLWSIRTSSLDASEGVRKKVDDVLSSMDDDSQNNQIYKDPTDPTKFFQGNDNSQWNDYVSYAFLAALLYLAAKAFGELNKLG